MSKNREKKKERNEFIGKLKQNETKQKRNLVHGKLEYIYRIPMYAPFWAD